MSDYKFDPSDFDLGSSDTESSSDSSSSFGNGMAANTALLPVYLSGVYTFSVGTGTVTSALTGVLGSGLAGVVALGLWIVGLVAAAFIGVFAVLTVAALVIGAARRRPPIVALGLFGAVVYAGAIGGALYFFAGLPLLVGMIVVIDLVLYLGTVALFLIGGLAAILLA